MLLGTIEFNFLYSRTNIVLFSLKRVLALTPQPSITYCLELINQIYILFLKFFLEPNMYPYNLKWCDMNLELTITKPVNLIMNLLHKWCRRK